jgi:hypothetical protein
MGYIQKRAIQSLMERAGGSEKAKPHSTREGRIAAGQRGIKRFLKSRKQPLKSPKGKVGRGYGKAYMKGGRAK